MEKEWIAPMDRERTFIEFVRYFYRRKAFHLEHSEERQGIRFGGKPILGKSLESPSLEGIPLSFLCHIDFSEMNGDGFSQELPTHGALSIFADLTFESNDHPQRFCVQADFHETELDKTSHQPVSGQSFSFDETFYTPVRYDSLPDWDEVLEFEERRMGKSPERNPLNHYARFLTEAYPFESWNQIGGYHSMRGLRFSFIREYPDSKNDFENWQMLLEICTLFPPFDSCLNPGLLYLFIHREKLLMQDFTDIRGVFVPLSQNDD